MISLHACYGDTAHDVMIDMADFLLENKGKYEYMSSSVFSFGDPETFCGQVYYWQEDEK